MKKGAGMWDQTPPPFPLLDPVIYELTRNRLARGTNDIRYSQ